MSNVPHTLLHLIIFHVLCACRVCGICSYYVPRSNPDGIAVTIACIEPGTVDSVDIQTYDGQNWEKSYKETSIAKESNPS